jgi:hypothetical protein
MANDSGFSEYDFDDSDLDDNEVVQAQSNPTNNPDLMPSLAEVGMSLAVAIHDLTETLHRIFPQSAPEPIVEEPTADETPAAKTEG